MTFNLNKFQKGIPLESNSSTKEAVIESNSSRKEVAIEHISSTKKILILNMLSTIFPYLEIGIITTLRAKADDQLQNKYETLHNPVHKF